MRAKIAVETSSSVTVTISSTYFHKAGTSDPPLLDGNPVCNGGHTGQRFPPVVGKGIVHGRRAAGLYPIHLALGVEGFDGKCHTGNQAAAAHGDNDCIYLGKLIEQFQADASLPGDDILIVERVDERKAFLSWISRALL